MVRFVTVVAAVCMWLTGCGPGNSRPIPMTRAEQSFALHAQDADPAKAKEARAGFVAEHQEWDEATKRAVLKGEVVKGMTRAQVRAAWSYGEIRQMAGGAIIDRQRRERWLYDRAPLLVMAYFRNDLFVEAKAYDRDDAPVGLARGEVGFLLPARTERPLPPGDTELLRRAYGVEPEW